MGETTGIAWCDCTVNFWIGCTQLSPACDHCYAMALAKRFAIPWNAPPRRTKANSWDKIARYQRVAKRWLAKHGRPRRVFINSMSDFADNQAERAWQDAACVEMEAAPDVIFILVTKRPQNIPRIVPNRWMRPGGWPRHIWVLVTAENQKEHDQRVYHLLDIPAPVRGCSFEPLLEEIEPWAFNFDIHRIGREIDRRFPNKRRPNFIDSLNWGIVGGESGPDARPMNGHHAIRLITAIRDVYQSAFMKQLSEAQYPKTYEDFDTFHPSLQHREFPSHD